MESSVPEASTYSVEQVRFYRICPPLVTRFYRICPARPTPFICLRPMLTAAVATEELDRVPLGIAISLEKIMQDPLLYFKKLPVKPD